MHWIINFLIVLAAYTAMEFMAWFTHKYVMHGFLWHWHEDHHEPHDKFFERNDRFFLVYAIPSAICYIVGSMYPEYGFLFYVGVGISLYGLTYFLIHDVYIHRRFKWFKQLDSKYSRAILRAHGAHHSTQGKEDAESFGLLVIHPKFFKSARKRKQEKKAQMSHQSN